MVLYPSAIRTGDAFVKMLKRFSRVGILFIILLLNRETTRLYNSSSTIQYIVLYIVVITSRIRQWKIFRKSKIL